MAIIHIKQLRIYDSYFARLPASEINFKVRFLRAAYIAV